MKCFLIAKPTTAGATTYIPKFKAITNEPKPNTCGSDPSSASVIIDSVEIIGVMKIFTVSLNTGFSFHNIHL